MAFDEEGGFKATSSGVGGSGVKFSAYGRPALQSYGFPSAFGPRPGTININRQRGYRPPGRPQQFNQGAGEPEE